MPEVSLPIPPTDHLTQKEFTNFYAGIFDQMGYMGTILAQSAHLRILLLHLFPEFEDPTKASLGELLDAAAVKGILDPKQLKHCHTILELQLYYSSKALVGLSTDTEKGVYFYGKMNEVLYHLTQLLEVESK